MTTLEIYISVLKKEGMNKIQEVLNSNKKELYLRYIGRGEYVTILTDDFTKLSDEIREYSCTNMVRDLNNQFKNRLMEALK